jgi:hypothetical protein
VNVSRTEYQNVPRNVSRRYGGGSAVTRKMLLLSTAAAGTPGFRQARPTTGVAPVTSISPPRWRDACGTFPAPVLATIWFPTVSVIGVPVPSTITQSSCPDDVPHVSRASADTRYRPVLGAVVATTVVNEVVRSTDVAVLL